MSEDETVSGPTAHALDEIMDQVGLRHVGESAVYGQPSLQLPHQTLEEWACERASASQGSQEEKERQQDLK